MARLEKIVATMTELFLEYADDQGKKRKLCKDELQAMLEKEIASENLKAKLNANDVKEVMEKFDKNRDEELNYREFCRCVCVLAKRYYRKEIDRKQKKDEGSN